MNADKARSQDIGNLTQQDVTAYLLAKEKGQHLLVTTQAMDKVETWVLHSLACSQPEAVQAMLGRIATVVTEYGSKLSRTESPHPQFGITDLLAYLNTSTAVAVMDYLNGRNINFLQSIILFAAQHAADNTNASVTYRRTKALFANDLIRQIYSPENVHETVAALL